MGRVISVVALLLSAVSGVLVYADDGAASVAAGGIIVMKREPRITMAKEVLQISAGKVVVDYDFRNDSDEDITTEVAFPIPDYEYDWTAMYSMPNFGDFRLWIDGNAARYDVERRAFLKKIEHTALLRRMGIDKGTFGHCGEKDREYFNCQDIQKLTATQRRQLKGLGLIDRDEEYALWRVQKKFHWQQTFPAHKTVHIKHEYSPYLGSTNSIKYGMGFDPSSKDEVEFLKTFCIDSRLKPKLDRIADSKEFDAPYFYVDFILTSANTWKTPIEDFTLIVERPHPREWKTKRDMGTYVSFCWNGPVTKIDADHFSAQMKDFVPKEELRIGFFTVESSR